jgi:hypothetical protein
MEALAQVPDVRTLHRYTAAQVEVYRLMKLMQSLAY